MTREEIKQKGQEKVKALENFCKQMQLSVSAEQMLTKEGLIKNVVYYLDTEKYELDQEQSLEPANPNQDENKEN
jgi:hypothetical protein